MRGLLDPATDGLNVVTTTVVAHTKEREFERLLVRV
jgi:hypothetical protein